MKDDKLKIEQRLQNMKEFYIKAGDLIDNLPDSIPEKTRSMLKTTILGDNELKSLMEGIDEHRPPRLFLIGRTGVGKSSLINALCGAYVAKVSDTTSCTSNANIYTCKDKDRVLMEIMDTRGIAESDNLDEELSAENALIRDINEFSPDVAIFMLNCTHRDDVDKDALFLKKVAEEYEKVNSVRLPIVVVVNKCDEMAPTRYKTPSEYPKQKVEKINEVVQYFKGIIMRTGLRIENIIPISALIDWQTPDGQEVSVEEIESLPQHDIDNLQIAFDGRYNIEELLDILEEAILDFEAQMGLRMAARLNDVVERIARHLNKIFLFVTFAPHVLGEAAELFSQLCRAPVSCQFSKMFRHVTKVAFGIKPLIAAKAPVVIVSPGVYRVQRFDKAFRVLRSVACAFCRGCLQPVCLKLLDPRILLVPYAHGARDDN